MAGDHKGLSSEMRGRATSISYAVVRLLRMAHCWRMREDQRFPHSQPPGHSDNHITIVFASRVQGYSANHVYCAVPKALFTPGSMQ